MDNYGIASGLLNVFYAYLQSGKNSNLAIRDPIRGVDVLAREYFDVFELRNRNFITQIKQEFLPEHIEKVYSKRARHHKSTDVNVVFSEEINIGSLDKLLQDKDIEKRQDQVWLEYRINGVNILAVDKNMLCVKVYAQEQQTSHRAIYVPHPIALQILDILYAEMEHRRLIRQQQIKEAESDQRRTDVLTSHTLGFRHQLPKLRIQPRRRHT